MASMTSKIKKALNAETVEVKDVYGDYQHVSINVVSTMFEDKSTVARQRMVYKVSITLARVSRSSGTGGHILPPCE